ncbi:Glycosyltransferase involved in cell wall bisynthesis [Mucilaginibacter lappiensis]|uniref:Glycosyltransferase involved in cell wall biosynthesis n=1 Tax=Mucilaginibacter lappiensis TaxID=354630 RepID=A0ABR6PMB2_9SPHI|nr:glycosyltransferase family 4 protein [Mucilaginibacter lappiensis]MBB6110904.1 glycosyltransferase involved in cell wall biosynthesis [Mucilaginibacter lappiensis]SIR61000.1 Glycosyltransferase involved in cell wall bisynthesis [Mucilaginibacter lappiensis]
MSKKVLLLTLQTFSTTGGIQKMTRTLGYTLNQIAKNNNWDFELWSAYDHAGDLMPEYLPSSNFKGFGINKLSFALKVLCKKFSFQDVVILSHINLAVIGFIIKIINPKCQVWLVAHGIEVWRPFSFIQKRFLKNCDRIICVSNYTKQQMLNWHHVDKDICIVLNNTIDPLMQLPATFSRPTNLLDRYQLNNSYPVVFTLTRMASTEKYKGHELVIEAIGKLKNKFPHIKYILSGKYDELEDVRINKLIANHDVSDQIILTGFIDEAELTDHFLLADLFVLPSKKEGFGIVFIEALACGLPVICGNADGSIDAIRNGELGKSVNTDNAAELYNCINESLAQPLTTTDREQLQKHSLRYFNQADYAHKLEELLTE